MGRDVYVGIDTSNYTTSLAVCDEMGEVLANWKSPLPVKPGECGLRQSDAVFAHIKNLPALLDRLQHMLHGEGNTLRVKGVAYSGAPRPIKDSYMPCFLTGEVAATALAAGVNTPLLRLSHQEGHVMAALYSAGAMHLVGDGECAPFVAFHVSGGTTDVLLIRPRKDGFDIEPLGTSQDLHAGQAVDRVGVHLGLDFPCGPALERLAQECRQSVPKPRVCVKGLCCHLSGLENLALSLYQKTNDAALTAAYTLDFIGATLIGVCDEIRRRYPDAPIVFSGGVMSNARIRGMIEKKYSAFFAEPQFSSDNAAGIALLCKKALQQ